MKDLPKGDDEVINILLKNNFFNQHPELKTNNDLFNIISFGMAYFEKIPHMSGHEKRKSVINLVTHVVRRQFNTTEAQRNEMLFLMDGIIDVIILVSKNKYVINKIQKHRWVMKYLCIFDRKKICAIQ